MQVSNLLPLMNLMKPGPSVSATQGLSATQAPVSPSGSRLTSSPSASASGSGSNAMNISPDSFMTLLIAQLQAQDPLNPVDPTQFVNQLVQFNTLEQIIQIRQILQNQGSGSGSGSTASNGSSAVGNGSTTSAPATRAVIGRTGAKS